MLQFGNSPSYDANAAHRADQIERRGARRAAEAASNGNYAKAAKIQRRSEARADDKRQQAYDNNNSVVQFRLP